MTAEEKEVEDFNKRFHLTKQQIDKFYAWQENLPDAYFGMDSNGIKVTFYGCSIGIIVKASRKEGEEIDLTDWENF